MRDLEALHRINRDIDVLMEKISDRIGSRYKLTLICRYTGKDFGDADILKSDDDFELAIAAIQNLAKREPTK